jgi:hypothetical protein
VKAVAAVSSRRRMARIEVSSEGRHRAGPARAAIVPASAARPPRAAAVSP